MSVEKFQENKFVLNRVFFDRTPPKSDSSKPEYSFNRSRIEEFWTFLVKYFEKTKKIVHHHSESTKYEELLHRLQGEIPDEWKDIDVIQTKLAKKYHCDKKRLSLKDLWTFRTILLMFVDFNLKIKAKKLEKLRQFQENLPINDHRQAILDNLRSNSVVLIAGDTGCGKSTQVPQYLLGNGYERICCTQPRRIACIALCNRLRYETADEYGSQIGFQIRFERSKTKSTKILFLTEGLLLRQMIEDPLLNNYQVIILDEIHERHLSSDFLLGAIKCLLHKRKNDLKVILMSATVNCELFSRYFGNCLVIKVPGRLYPIKIEYFPMEKVNIFRSSSAKINPEPYLKLLKQIDDLHSSSERGDVLIFLSGFNEIETVGEKLKPYADESKRWVILYLHSALPLAEQDKVFDIAPDGMRKCILSTNIAETSITIDGIRFVVDSGKVKEMYYESKIRMHRLQELWISKASAEQRKGRAGRTGPGICYRLYSQNDYENFDDFSKPEIQRVSLESLLLNMISMGLNDVRKFPFIEPPGSMEIENTLKCLINYGTLDWQERITYLGRILSQLPVDIPIGKMLIYSLSIGMQEFALTIAALLSVQSLTTIRSRNNVEMLESRKSMITLDGDLFSSMNFYRKWLILKGQPDRNTREWCRRLGFEEQRFHEITKLRRQFEEILKDAKLLEPNHQNDQNQDSSTTLTKAERIAKHGERKLYRKLKMEIGSGKSKRRRVLNINQNMDETDETAPDPEWNLKELEFNLNFDARYFQEIERKHSIKPEHVGFIKQLLSLSFYPQLALADLDNSFSSGSDQMFHTKDKPFVVLHPTSVYYTEPDVLKSVDVESSPLGNLAYQHWLLGYISFIETNKSYICNCYQVSAIHTLLLCANQIDTTKDCDRIVCDQWIEVNFKYHQDGEHLLLNALELRQKFDEFQKLVFEYSSQAMENDQPMTAQELDEENLGNFKKDLMKSFKVFLKHRIKYSLKRLLAADIKTIYRNVEMNVEDLKELKHDSKLVKYFLEHPEQSNATKPNTGSTVVHQKGGFSFAFIQYNCLQEQGSHEQQSTTGGDNRRMFHCEQCSETMFVGPIEQIRHSESCTGSGGGNVPGKSSSTETVNIIEAATTTSILKRYFCQDCNKELMLKSNIDILRHRRKHSEIILSKDSSG